MMTDDFEPHDIYVCVGGIDYVDNSDYTNWSLATENGSPTGDERFLATGLFKKQGHITAYFFDENTANGGSAYSIVSDHFFVGGNLNNLTINHPSHSFIYPDIKLLSTSVTSHELAHCLGLYHTFENNDGLNYDFPGNPNCLIDGDKVCDTPPDIDMRFQVSNHPNCNFFGTFLAQYTGWHGDTENLMAYSHPNCLSNITDGQAQRMYSQMEQSPILDPIIQEVKLNGLDLLPNNTTSQYSISIENGQLPQVTNWQVSPNIRIISINGSTITVEKNTPCVGKGWIQATLDVGTCTAIKVCKAVSIQQNILAGTKSYSCGSNTATCDDSSPFPNPQCECGAAAFIAYPNPSTKEMLTVKMVDTSSENWEFELRTSDGEIILRQTNIGKKKVDISLKELSLKNKEGLLLLDILYKGQIEQKKIWLD